MAAACSGRKERAWARALAVAASVVLLDQASKQAAVELLANGRRVSLVPGLDLALTFNTGVAFGALRGFGDTIGWLVAVTLALLLVHFLRSASTPWLWLPVGAIVGGALSNLADRARVGAVIDYIDPVAWPAFNLADSAIVLGVAGLVLVGERAAKRAARADEQRAAGP